MSFNGGITSLAAACMDTMPHNRSFTILFSVAGLAHIQSHRYISGFVLINAKSFDFIFRLLESV